MAAELRACAQEEAGLQTRLHAASEALTAAEVRSQRARDQDGRLRSRRCARSRPSSSWSRRAAEQPLEDERRQELRTRLERLAKRREQLGPVNPLAQDEYADALAHVEELEAQRTDLETALRELEGLIRDTDRQIRETFEETFEAAAEELRGARRRGVPGRHAAGCGWSRSRRARAAVIGGQKLEGGEEALADAESETRRARGRRAATRICSASRSRSRRPARR